MQVNSKVENLNGVAWLKEFHSNLSNWLSCVLLTSVFLYFADEKITRETKDWNPRARGNWHPCILPSCKCVYSDFSTDIYTCYLIYRCNIASGFLGCKLIIDQKKGPDLGIDLMLCHSLTIYSVQESSLLSYLLVSGNIFFSILLQKGLIFFSQVDREIEWYRMQVM